MDFEYIGVRTQREGPPASQADEPYSTSGSVDRRRNHPAVISIGAATGTNFAREKLRSFPASLQFGGDDQAAGRTWAKPVHGLRMCLPT